MKGKHSVKLVNTGAKLYESVSKMAERNVPPPPPPLLRPVLGKQSSVWKFAFLCRRDSLIQNDCGNCAICSTLVTFNAPEKWGCCAGE